MAYVRRRSQRRGNTSVQHAGYPDNLPPREVRKIKHRSVGCPECLADIDDPCISKTTGESQTSYHVSRRRIAIRIDNERRFSGKE